MNCRTSAALLAIPLALGAAHADVKVAFLGDQGGDVTARQVLDLVRDEGTDLLVLQGDYAYDWGIRSWLDHMERALGPDFPVLGVVGNHEGSDWPTYKRWFERRVERVPGLDCEGDVGVKAHCTYRGLSVVQTAPGIDEVAGVRPDDGYADYVEDRLEGDPNAWRICSFHKTMRRMQVGLKQDRTGWGVYEACREGGAIVATAHSHTYSRTHLMSDFGEQRVVHENDHLEVGPGRSFAFVSGLGGKSVRPQARGGDWFAAIHTATQGATHGALFCTFDGDRASCAFKDIAGGVVDRFTLETRNRGESGDREPLAAIAPADTGSSSPGSATLAAPSGLRWRRHSSRSGELSWIRPATPGLRYEIRRDGVVVGVTDGVSRGTKGLSSSRTYRFEVIAIDAAGRRSAPAAIGVSSARDAAAPTPSSGGSSSAPPDASASSGASASAPSDDGLVAVRDLRANVYSSRTTELFWRRPSTPGLRYEIRRDGSTAVTTNGTSFLDRTLSKGIDYRYEIVAIDRSGRRSAASVITVNTARR